MAIFNTLRLTSLALAISIIPLAYSAEYALVADYLIDGYSDQLLKNKAIIVKDHKITEVLDVSDIPKQITRLELPGTTLMPGMINAHEHPLLYKNDYQKRSSPSFLRLQGPNRPIYPTRTYLRRVGQL